MYLKKSFLFVANFVLVECIYLFLVNNYYFKINNIYAAAFIMLLVFLCANPMCLTAVFTILTITKFAMFLFFLDEGNISIYVFSISLLGIESLLFLIYKYELGEAFYFIPPKNQVTLPRKKIDGVIIDTGFENKSVSIIRCSEIYLVLYIENNRPLQSELVQLIVNLGCDEFKINLKQCWTKNGYIAFEILNQKSKQNDSWELCYNKIQQMNLI